jgi:hypothetical protein
MRHLRYDPPDHVACHANQEKGDDTEEDDCLLALTLTAVGLELLRITHNAAPSTKLNLKGNYYIFMNTFYFLSILDILR